MKRLILIILIVCVAIIGLISPVRAQMATMDEALTVATNWIYVIIQEKGNWGGYEEAEVENIQEFKRGERVLGYFCHVKPKGYIVVSLRKEMAPIKAYSSKSDLDPASDKGMADLLKGSMERILDKIEQVEAQEKAGGAQRLEDILEINYRDDWENLEHNVEAFMEKSEVDVNTTTEESQGDESSPNVDYESGGEESNYQEGDVLLSSDWHQGDPFNQQVPAPPAGDDCTAAHCAVGCVALAGAQIMRYWNWPPYGVGSPYNDTYDWPNMPDTLTGASPAAQINAVAELCHEVGMAVNMNYCSGTGVSACGSGAYTYDMEDVYEDHYRYWTSCGKEDRDAYTAVDWFNMMKNEFNYNRPVQYRITGHSIVGDGWQEIGGGPTRQYHMNYGWIGTGTDAWYTLDTLTVDPEGEEYLLRYILPYPYVVSSGTYTRQSFPYRYFYRDLSLSSATTFEGGQRLQFLPNIVLTYSGSSGSIRFEGSSSYYSHLFTRGDLSRGVRIYPNANAVIEMNQNGTIRFY